MKKKSILSRINFMGILYQFIIIFVLDSVLHFLFGTSSTATFVVYIVAFYILRSVLTSNYMKANRLFEKQNYEAAAEEYLNSYEYFNNNKWADKYRVILLINFNDRSYRELSLLKAGYCYKKINYITEARNCYEKAVSEFPESEAALKALEKFNSENK